MSFGALQQCKAYRTLPAKPAKKHWALDISDKGRMPDEHPVALFEENGKWIEISAITVRERTLQASYSLLSKGPHWLDNLANGDSVRITRHSTSINI